jgi:hypothetical protein
MLTTIAILNFFYTLVGENVDETTALILANFVKDLVEADRPWHFLIAEDATKTYGSGENYLTQKTLPTDFARPHKLFLGDATLKDFQEYKEIPFEQRRRYNDITNRFYVDYKNGKFFITGAVDKTYTIYLYYIYQTPTLTLSVNPVWQERFIPLIAYLMAYFYASGMDNDEITARQAASHNVASKLLFDSFIDFDARIRAKQQANQTPMEEGDEPFYSGKVNVNL